MYGVGAYYLAKIILEFPMTIVTSMLYAVIMYFKIGLTIAAGQFFYFFLILFLISNCATSFGYFMSSIFNKEETAVQISPVIMMPIMLFGG
jgi:ATP-binding cassette subfamily G (WHITE) protein 1